ncbi:MAG: adenylosuccinate lyase, partial [Gemmatimonadaceae bacterium]|nr:adenylosuccinate lyase [Gemmatimonadaceae bacterium]
RAGGDRQQIHEVIRVLSIAAARAMKDEGAANDMLQRLAADPAYPVAIADLQDALDPARFTGRATQQVTEFLLEVVRPILDANGAVDAGREEVRV